MVVHALGCVGVLSLCNLTACGSDRAGGAPSPAFSLATTYWQLALNQHAVTMAVAAPYDTFRLRPRALNAHGDSIALGGVPHYLSSDSCITVDANGLVTARYETIARGAPAYIIASMQDSVQNVTHADTMFIQVTPTAPASPFATLTIQPSAAGQDSASISDVGIGYAPFTITVADQRGGPMPNVLVAFTSSDSTIATIDTRTINSIGNAGGTVSGVRMGTVTFYATAWAYGIAQRDSVQFTLTISNVQSIGIYSKTPYASVTPVLYFYPASVVIGRGGVVTWDATVDGYSVSHAIDVVFDDPAHVDSAAALNHPDYGFPYTGTGNFSGLFVDTVALNSGDYATYLFHIFKARRFPVPGTYHYHSATYGSTGTIIVQ